MRSNSLATLLFLALTSSASAWQVTEAHAQGRKAPSATKQDERISTILTNLSSSQPSSVRVGYEQMRELGADAAAAVPTANRVLGRGLPVELATTAIRALSTVGQTSSSEAILPYLRHRHVELRREAAKALIKTKGEAAKRGLMRALSDLDPTVRGIAATGLGELGVGEYVDRLFSALDHGVPEAAAAIGQLCAPEQCEDFASRTGRVSFDIMITGFDQILFRDPKQMPDDQKIRIISRIRKVGTRDAHVFLKDIQSRWPANWAGPVKKELDSAVQSTQGSPGGGA